MDSRDIFNYLFFITNGVIIILSIISIYNYYFIFSNLDRAFFLIYELVENKLHKLQICELLLGIFSIISFDSIFTC
jgi:hypothetical protein